MGALLPILAVVCWNRMPAAWHYTFGPFTQSLPRTPTLPYNEALMIAFLRGTLLEKHPNQVIVDTGGVGYDVVIPVSTFSALPDAGAEVRLRIHTHVREDVLSLFGFLTPEEKGIFEKLISV